MTDLERELAKVLEIFVYAPFVERKGEVRRLEPTTQEFERARTLLERVKGRVK